MRSANVGQTITQNRCCGNVEPVVYVRLLCCSFWFDLPACAWLQISPANFLSASFGSDRSCHLPKTITSSYTSLRHGTQQIEWQRPVTGINNSFVTLLVWLHSLTPLCHPVSLSFYSMHQMKMTYTILFGHVFKMVHICLIPYKWLWMNLSTLSCLLNQTS